MERESKSFYGHADTNLVPRGQMVRLAGLSVMLWCFIILSVVGITFGFVGSQ